MNIDFPLPSKGTYNNAGSSRQLANYLEHEDLERMEKGIYTEGFFDLTEGNLYKSQVIKDIDKDIGQLLKTDAKFYAIHVSPSTKELQAMGTTEQEQFEAMKRYIREVFIPEYAKNFNKGLTESDIKFYGKIHFERGRDSNNGNGNNMHCHIIVSRKDQSNKIKISPLTNHKNTKKGVVKGGFERTNLFQQVEQGFDNLFNYQRPITETFEYCNTLKNGSIDGQLKMQERVLKQTDTNQQKQIQKQASEQENTLPSEKKNESEQIGINESTNQSKTQHTNESVEQSTSTPDLGLSSALGIFSPEVHGENPEDYIRKVEERKKRRGLGR